MADNLNFNDAAGEYSFFSARTAWHDKGQLEKGILNSEDALRESHLDFTVEKRPAYTTDSKGNYIRIPGQFATVRTDNEDPLGAVGNKYKVLQNVEAFKFIDEIVGSKEVIFESAGALGRGERIFLTCKLPQKLVVGKDDVADNYFFLTNSHDGSKEVEMAFTQTFIVCENTLREALRNCRDKQRTRHTTNVYSNLMKGADLMGITRQNLAEQKEMFDAMTKVKITDPQLRRFIELAMRPKAEKITPEEFSERFVNKVDEVLAYSLTASAQRIPEREGTIWGAYNAVTGFYNNVQEYKDGSEHKLKSIMYGTAYHKSQKALDIAIGVLTNQINLS